MSRAERDSDREGLERELQDVEYVALLRKVQETSESLRRYACWAEVLRYIQGCPLQDERRDAVLLDLFTAWGRDSDSRWRSVLLAIFWPALEAVFRKRRGWDRDPETLWQNLLFGFLRAAESLDLAQRSERLTQKLLNDANYHLHQEYRREWHRSEQELSVEPDQLPDTACPDPSDGLDSPPPADALIRLRRHLESGRISEGDYLLLVATHGQGKPLVDYAREQGLDYQALKKRRQRAEAAVRAAERLAKKAPDSLSPPQAAPPYRG